MTNGAIFHRWSFYDCKVGFRLHSLPVPIAIPTVSNGLSKRGMSTTAKVWWTGWTQIFVMARDEMKQFSSSRLGVAPSMTIARSYLKLRNWQLRSGGHLNLRLKQRSRRRPASLPCVKFGPTVFWTVFQAHSEKAKFSRHRPSFLVFARQGRAYRPP